MKIYKSKVDWWLIILIGCVFGYPIIDGILTNEYFLSAIFASVLVLFFLLSKTIKPKLRIRKKITKFEI